MFGFLRGDGRERQSMGSKIEKRWGSQFPFIERLSVPEKDVMGVIQSRYTSTGFAYSGYYGWRIMRLVGTSLGCCSSSKVRSTCIMVSVR